MSNHLDVVAAVMVCEGEILLARRKQGKSLAGKYEFPGGKVEPGETLQEALHRELREEFGVSLNVAEYICTNKHAYPTGPMIVLHAYWVDVQTRDLQSSDHDDLRWVAPARLNDYDIAEADIPIVQFVQSVC